MLRHNQCEKQESSNQFEKDQKPGPSSEFRNLNLEDEIEGYAIKTVERISETESEKDEKLANTATEAQVMDNIESNLEVETRNCDKTYPRIDDFDLLLEVHTIMKNKPQETNVNPERDEYESSRSSFYDDKFIHDESDNKEEFSSTIAGCSDNSFANAKESTNLLRTFRPFTNHNLSIIRNSEESHRIIKENFTDNIEQLSFSTQHIKLEPEDIKLEPDDIKLDPTDVMDTEDSILGFVSVKNLDKNMKEENVSSAGFNDTAISFPNINTNKKTDARFVSKRKTNITKKNYCELQSSDEENFMDYDRDVIGVLRTGTSFRRNTGPVWTAEEEKVMTALKMSKKTFLQHVPCTKLTSSVTKCRECRRRDLSNRATGSIFCRFFEFRTLQFDESGRLQVSGFSNPYLDPKPDDLNIWLTDKNDPSPTRLDINVCRYILLHLGDQFCYLWRQESEAIHLHMSKNKIIAWKKVVRGVREICDVCDTTIFNYHWTCHKCGFGVCIDCYKDRKQNRTIRRSRNASKERRDDYYWLMCTYRECHNITDLMLTQIIAGDSLNEIGKLMHEVRSLFHIPQLCNCMLARDETILGSPGIDEMIYQMISETSRPPTRDQIEMDKCYKLLESLGEIGMEEMAKFKRFQKTLQMGFFEPHLDQRKLEKDPISHAYTEYKDVTFLREGLAGPRRFLPPKIMTFMESKKIAPRVPHQWLCDGKLLRLKDGKNLNNRELFQEVWKCGQPVMVSNVSKYLNMNLWRPEAFCKDFGEIENDLVNCLNGNLVPSQPMKHFWEGFQCIQKRLLDSNGDPMLLKLKDWPPGEDFAEILPTRFSDLMSGLPLPEYTLRSGVLNIASCLPDIFVRPDLGPKMYNAYGSALHPNKGTTNLHLDISDAVNIMVYVGIPKDSDAQNQLQAAYESIDRGGCDFFTRKRVREPNVLPGALWHIFSARDADKIRDLLNRVTIEKGYRLEADHDPIHDQNWYLDDNLRGRLYDEYGVEGYPIVQCLGDAVFIPAGAPHQVQNLHNCIKVAEDFVSPENITHCYHLTHEFRRLSHSHSNHEDKLQIKNIIYHATKDCAMTLIRLLDAKIRELEALVDEKAKKASVVNHCDVYLTQKQFDLLSTHADISVEVISEHGGNVGNKENDDDKEECEYDINKCKEIIQAEFEEKLAEAFMSDTGISVLTLPKPLAEFGWADFKKRLMKQDVGKTSLDDETQEGPLSIKEIMKTIKYPTDLERMIHSKETAAIDCQKKASSPELRSNEIKIKLMVNEANKSNLADTKDTPLFFKDGIEEKHCKMDWEQIKQTLLAIPERKSSSILKTADTKIPKSSSELFKRKDSPLLSKEQIEEKNLSAVRKTINLPHELVSLPSSIATSIAKPSSIIERTHTKSPKPPTELTLNDFKLELMKSVGDGNPSAETKNSPCASKKGIGRRHCTAKWKLPNEVKSSMLVPQSKSIMLRRNHKILAKRLASLGWMDYKIKLMNKEVEFAKNKDTPYYFKQSEGQICSALDGKEKNLSSAIKLPFAGTSTKPSVVKRNYKTLAKLLAKLEWVDFKMKLIKIEDKKTNLDRERNISLDSKECEQHSKTTMEWGQANLSNKDKLSIAPLPTIAPNELGLNDSETKLIKNEDERTNFVEKKNTCLDSNENKGSRMECKQTDLSSATKSTSTVPSKISPECKKSDLSNATKSSSTVPPKFPQETKRSYKTSPKPVTKLNWADIKLKIVRSANEKAMGLQKGLRRTDCPKSPGAIRNRRTLFNDHLLTRNVNGTRINLYNVSLNAAEAHDFITGTSFETIIDGKPITVSRGDILKPKE